jgi:hypothetical protein
VAAEKDEINIWSEVKLAIIKEYASAYARIMDAQRRERIPSLRWFYIDAYAGSGHKFVPKPMPMKTKTNSVIYYLYFASQKEAGMDIVTDIFNKYRAKQGL